MSFTLIYGVILILMYELIDSFVYMCVCVCVLGFILNNNINNVNILIDVV